MARVLVSVAKFAGAAVLLRDYVGEVAFCTGESMLPTLQPRGDVLYVDKTFLALGRPLCRGDVIVCASPSEASRLICKRVVGLSGDIVWSRRASSGILPVAVHVPRGHVWIEGDNAAHSQDSRAFGPLPMGLVRGRAFCKEVGRVCYAATTFVMGRTNSQSSCDADDEACVALSQQPCAHANVKPDTRTRDNISPAVAALSEQMKHVLHDECCDSDARPGNAVTAPSLAAANLLHTGMNAAKCAFELCGKGGAAIESRAPVHAPPLQSESASGCEADSETFPASHALLGLSARP